MNRFNGTFEDLLGFAGITDPTLDQRMEMLEQRVKTIEEPLQTMEQRLTDVEQRLDTMGLPTLTMIATCTASSLHVRSGPGITYPSIGYLLKGQQVTVLSRKDGWAQLENPAGWSSEKYLNIQISASQSDQSTLGQPAPEPSVPEQPPSNPEPTPAPEADPIVYATCTASSLYVRSGPGTNYPPVAGLVKGQQVKVLSRQDGWAQLEKPAGWSSEKYLAFEQSVFQPEQFVAELDQPASEFASVIEEEASTFAICTANSLYVRGGPDTSYPVTGILVHGQQVKILDRRNGWAQVEDPAGWGSEQYLEAEQSVPVPASDPKAEVFPENIAPEIFAMNIANNLNVRSGSGSSYPVVGRLQQGQRVKVLTRQNGWVKIEQPAGWSSEKYLKYV